MSRIDDFGGDNAHLVECINALLDLDDAKALVPHGLGKGSHAYRLLNAAAHRLPTASASTTGGDKDRENPVARPSEDELVEALEKAAMEVLLDSANSNGRPHIPSGRKLMALSDALAAYREKRNADR